MSKQSDFDKCLMSHLEGYRKKIHGENFSPSQKELFPGLKRDLNMEIEDAARSDDPLEACMERRGYKPSKTQVFQDAISAKLTADMFGKQEKLTGAEAMFQEQMQECLDKLKTRPKLKFGLGNKKVSERFFKSGGGERMHVGPETPRKNSALDNLVTNIMFDLDTTKFRALHKYMEKEGINLQTDDRQILTAQLAKAMKDKRIASAIMSIIDTKKRTIPEQTDFINPSQMTLFGRLQNSDSLPPILAWVGGKTKLADKIISMMPKHKVYVEPFLGGGSVFFKKPLSDVNVINDLDKDLINFYKGVRDVGCEKIRACKFPKNKTEFNKAVEGMGKEVCDYLGVNKRSYRRDNNDPHFCDGLAKRGDNAVNFREKCERYEDKLKQAKLLNKDYKDVIEKYDSKDTLYYIDPPYVDKNRYKHNDIEPEGVAKVVKSMKGKAIVSYNNHPRVRKAFAGLKFHKVNMAYSTQRGPHKNISELLITNF